MKLSLLMLILTLGISTVLAEAPAHLDIMVPDIRDTDLIGPVKSVELKLWQNVSADFITEKREYDPTGNLLQITEHNGEGELVDVTTFQYGDDGCYERMVYKNEEKGYTNEWQVVLNPDTRQIALREVDGDRIGIESYSPDGYLISYRLMGADRKPIVTREYKRNENNRLTMYKRIEGRTPAYTYYYKWADNGFIDMEAQTYHQDKDKRRHTYEYLVTDDQGNWTSASWCATTSAERNR
jgi:hypothetical protein